MDIRWLTAFLDAPAVSAPASERFWLSVTASRRSPSRGRLGEFATLVPPTGDPFLRVQVLGAGPARVHLDLHVADVGGAVEQAGRLGASVTAEPDGYAALRSPGGLEFCLVPHEGEARRPAPVTWAGAGNALVDQVCIDAPADVHAAEAAFWAELTGWRGLPSLRPEFSALLRPTGMPLRLLLQRLDGPSDAVRAHLDLACDDVGAEALRHQALGATQVRRAAHWVTLQDPAGREYCVTARHPDTGRIPG